MKSVIMKEAWVKAKRAVSFKGGKAIEWMAWAMVRAWADFKAGKLNEQKAEYVRSLRGMMTEKQENFIASLLRKKHTDNPVAQAFNVSSLRGSITKQQASNLIDELLAA